MMLSLFPQKAVYALNVPAIRSQIVQAGNPIVQSAAALSASNVLPAANDLIQGDGYTWDDTAKTLTITASTGDFGADYTGRPYQDYRTKAENLVIDGNENTVIGAYAFNGFSSVKTITIKTCGNIKSYAFKGCTQTTALSIEKSGEIGDHAFNGLFNLKTVTIGNCGDIKDRAFGGCSSLQSIAINACGNFDEYVFQNCSKLTEATIGTCGDFVQNVFAGCSGLQSIRVTKECGTIGKSAFSGLSKLSALEIAKCGDILNRAFNGCASLTKLTLNCGNIGSNVFNKCTGMKELTITNCGDIGSSAFLGMTNLETVTIESCGNIGSSAFSSMTVITGAEPCSTLKKITIEKCGDIGSYAFYNLKNLEEITIRDCAKIGSYAFWATGAPIQELTLKNCIIDEYAFYSSDIMNLTLEDMEAIGDGAFVNSDITNLTLRNIKTLGLSSFAYLDGLTNLTIENLERIDESSFEASTINPDENKVELITLKNVDYIGNYAFYNFKNLKKVVIDGSCGYVGAHAFSGCDSLNVDGAIVIQDETKLGYSNSLVHQTAILDRVTAVLNGMFSLVETQTPIDQIFPEGWTSVKTGENNRTEQVGDTQLTKAAKWNDAEKTVADILLKAYYSVNQQMDFIIVADCSNSMAGFGSSDAKNSNFYNMQSKMMDVAGELLNAENLDTRIAFSTFGDADSAVSRFFEKGEEEAAREYIWNDIVNYESDTNYSTGLAGALELVKRNAGRNTTVIFISDGQPYYSLGEIPESYYGEEEAKAIKAEGVQIISVLQQVPENELASSQANMEKIADKVFASTDLAGFSNAVNDAVDYAYSTYTLTDTIDPAFDLDESSIRASAGTVKLEKDTNGNTILIWTISGMPFKEHTLTFQENLKANENGIHPTGSLDTNEGKAVLNNGGTDINTVETPALSRGESLTVEKIWQGDNTDARPDSVSVVLLRNGEAFETINLTAEQGWSHTWPALDEAYDWSVKEEIVPSGYHSAVSSVDGVWTITNVYEHEPVSSEPEPPASSEPEEPVTSEPEPPVSSEPEEPVTSEPEPPVSSEPGELVSSQPDASSSSDPVSAVPEAPVDDIPGTGGSVNTTLWILLLTVAAGGLTITILCTRKKKA